MNLIIIYEAEEIMSSSGWNKNFIRPFHSADVQLEQLNKHYEGNRGK